MKRSQFNYFVNRDDAIMAYNARTGNFTLMSVDVARILQGTSSLADLTGQDELCELGFLHEGDELEKIESRFISQRNHRKHIHLALLPTMKCNLDCEYCFQRAQHRAVKMSKAVQTAILQNIKELVKTGCDYFQVSWYGGEPLLAKDIVLSMTKKLKKYLSDNNIKSEFTMVTNGTLLDLNLSKELALVGVESIQVSVDSLYQSNGRRSVLSDDNNLSTIICNAVNACKVIDVSVRVNVDNRNKDELSEIVSILRDNGLNSIIFAKVHNFEIECRLSPGGKLTEDKYVTPQEYSFLELTNLLNNTYALQLMLRRLQPKSHFCAATSGGMIVIDPNGDITHCWETIGIDGQIVGNIKNMSQLEFDTNNSKGWLNYSPLNRAECRECCVLPLCMGSCANPIVVHGADHSICESIRYTIQQSVQAVGRHLEISDEQFDLVT